MRRIRPSLRPPTLLVLALAVAVALAACDGREADALREDNAALTARVAEYERERAAWATTQAELEGVQDALRARVAELEAEVDDLRTTEEALWAAAVAHRGAGELDQAEATLARLVARHPDGARRAEADALRSGLAADRAQRLPIPATPALVPRVPQPRRVERR